MATALENQLQNFRIRFHNSQLGRFVQWWIAELHEMLPAAWRARMQHARRRVITRISNSDLAVAVHESGAIQELDVYSLEQNVRVQRQQVRDLLQDRELLEVARDLVLPEERVLRKEIVLPIAAEANLRQALSFEMDRQTPFNSSEVYFDYQVLSRDKESGQLRIRLLVTQKEPLNRDIALLTPRGMAPTGVDVEIEGRPAGLNLLPPEMRFAMVNRRARTNLLLAGAAIVLLALVMAQSLWLRQHQIGEVQAAIDQVREEALRVQQIRDQIKDTSEAAGFMLGQRAEVLPTVRIMAEVTRVLPDDTFLDRLLIGDRTIQVQGKSENAQQLIELINQSPYFSDASFRGPTRLDTRTQKEIFDLTASARQEGEG
jgi:general secretion pathway protein L